MIAVCLSEMNTLCLIQTILFHGANTISCCKHYFISSQLTLKDALHFSMTCSPDQHLISNILRNQTKFTKAEYYQS